MCHALRPGFGVLDLGDFYVGRPMPAASNAPRRPPPSAMADF